MRTKYSGRVIAHRSARQDVRQAARPLAAAARTAELLTVFKAALYRPAAAWSWRAPQTPRFLPPPPDVGYVRSGRRLRRVPPGASLPPSASVRDTLRADPELRGVGHPDVRHPSGDVVRQRRHVPGGARLPSERQEEAEETTWRTRFRQAQEQRR